MVVQAVGSLLGVGPGVRVISGFYSATWSCHGDCFHRSLVKMAATVWQQQQQQRAGHTMQTVGNSHCQERWSQTSSQDL